MKIWNEALGVLEDAIQAERPKDIRAMLGDRWLLASALHKSIRRGQADCAVRAASSLWHQDRQSFWRRLHITALEDIGATSPEVTVAVLMATASSPWRRRIGDFDVAIYLTRLMCGAVKNRMGDELFIQAETSSEYRSRREALAKADDETLAGHIQSNENSLIERAIALWLLCGTKKYPSELMPERKGSPAKAAEVLRSLKAPHELTEACIAVMSRTSWPLAIHAPLIWQEAQKQPHSPHVSHKIVPDVPEVDEIPVFAADVFTRTGQSSLRLLQKSFPELRRFTVKQLGLALFYIEGGLVDKLLTSQTLEEFCKAGEVADIESAGLCLPEYLGMRECLKENLDRLHEIRCSQLHQYLEGGWHD